MKHLLVFLLAVLCIALAQAQVTLTATLNHNDTITIYKGTTALSEALNTAEDGDAIYLSPGVFSDCTIAKRVSIIGAGMGDPNDDSTDANGRTVFSYLRINVDSEESTLILEGLKGSITFDNNSNLENINITKCYLKSADYYGQDSGNITFLNCYLETLGIHNGANFFNCYVYSNDGTGDQCTNFFRNCIVRGAYFVGWTFSNCILEYYYQIYNHSNNAYLTLINCLLYGSFNLDTCTSENIVQISDLEALYKEDSFYELTDEAAALYLGDDGTQIGIYGGDSPWDIEPSNPQISKVTVPLKPDVNGILPIQVEIKK